MAPSANTSLRGSVRCPCSCSGRDVRGRAGGVMLLLREQVGKVRVVREAEVEQHGFAVGPKDEILRLDVEMNDVLAVHRCGWRRRAPRRCRATSGGASGARVDDRARARRRRCVSITMYGSSPRRRDATSRGTCGPVSVGWIICSISKLTRPSVGSPGPRPGTFMMSGKPGSRSRRRADGVDVAVAAGVQRPTRRDSRAISLPGSTRLPHCGGRCYSSSASAPSRSSHHDPAAQAMPIPPRNIQNHA